MSLLAADELYLINSDTKYKSYMTSIEKALKNFESSTEWADLIASLGKLKKIIQSFPKYTFIPKKLSISKRLTQCLHPALPSGVHLKALEVYTIIFQNIGRENLSRDLPLYANGLFPLLANAALSVKPVLLGIYETYFVPLRELLRPCLVGIILAVLPGLEEGSDFYTRSFNLLKSICHAQSSGLGISSTSTPTVAMTTTTTATLIADDKYFHTCLWTALIAQPSVRFPAIQFILVNYENKRKLLANAAQAAASITSKDQRNDAAKLSTEDDQLYLIGNSIDLMINGICLCLQDSNPLVQRSILDFLCLCLPMDTQQITKEDKLQLIVVAIHVILRRDMSLNRRIYTWLAGNAAAQPAVNATANGLNAAAPASKKPATATAGGANFFQAHSKTLLINAIKVLLNNFTELMPSSNLFAIAKQPILYLQLDETYISTPHTSNVAGLSSSNQRATTAMAPTVVAPHHHVMSSSDQTAPPQQQQPQPARAILNNISQTSTSVSTNSTLKILKILSNLVERPEIGSAIVQEILLDLLLRIQTECDQLMRHGCELSSGNKNLVIFQTSLGQMTSAGDSANCTDKNFVNSIINPTNRTRNAYSETIFQLKMRELNELKKATANFLFQSFQISFIFEFLSASFERVCAAAPTAPTHRPSSQAPPSQPSQQQLTISNICDLYEFLLELVTKSEMFTDSYTRHLSLMLKDLVKSLEAHCPRMSNADLSKSFVLCINLMEKISSRATTSSTSQCGQPAAAAATTNESLQQQQPVPTSLTTASSVVVKRRSFQETSTAAADQSGSGSGVIRRSMNESSSAVQLAAAAAKPSPSSQNQSFESKSSSSSSSELVDQIVSDTLDSIIKAIETDTDYECPPAVDQLRREDTVSSEAPLEVVEDKMQQQEEELDRLDQQQDQPATPPEQREDSCPVEYSLYYLKQLTHKFIKSHVFSLDQSTPVTAASSSGGGDDQISRSFESIFKTSSRNDSGLQDDHHRGYQTVGDAASNLNYADLIRKCFNLTSGVSAGKRSYASFEDIWTSTDSESSPAVEVEEEKEEEKNSSKLFMHLKQEDYFSSPRDSNACEYLPSFQLLNKLLVRVISFPQHKVTIKSAPPRPLSSSNSSSSLLSKAAGQSFDFWFKDLVVACCCSRFDSKLNELDKMSSIKSEILEPKRILFEYQVTALNTILKLVELSTCSLSERTPSRLFSRSTQESSNSLDLPLLEPVLSQQQLDLLLNKSYFGISCALSLWSYLGGGGGGSSGQDGACEAAGTSSRSSSSWSSNSFERRAAILYCLLHEILPNSLCEDIIAHGLLFKNAKLTDNTVLAVRMDSFERFASIWYWSRVLKINTDQRKLGAIRASYLTKMERDIDIMENELSLQANSKSNSSRLSTPPKTFERSLFLVYDIMGSVETPRVFANQVEHWFAECVSEHEDLSRLLDSLLIALLSPQTARISIQNVLKSCTLLNSASKVVIAPGEAGSGDGLGNLKLQYMDPVSAKYPYKSNTYDDRVIKFFEIVEGANVVCNKSNNKELLTDESKIFAISHEDGNVTYHVNNTPQQQQPPKQLLMTTADHESPNKNSNRSTAARLPVHRNIELPAPILSAALLKNSQHHQSIQIKIGVNRGGGEEDETMPSYTSRITTPRGADADPEKTISGEATTGSARVLTEYDQTSGNGGGGLKIATNHRISSYDELSNLDYNSDQKHRHHMRPQKTTNGGAAAADIMSKSNNDLTNSKFKENAISPDSTALLRKAGTLDSKTTTGAATGGSVSRSTNVRTSFNESAMTAERKQSTVVNVGSGKSAGTGRAQSTLNWIDISRLNFVDPNYAHMLVYCNCSNISLELAERKFRKDELLAIKHSKQQQQHFLPDDYQLPSGHVAAADDGQLVVVKKLSVQTVSSSPFFSVTANTFDHGQTLFMLRCIEQMLLKCKSDLLVPLATTRIKPAGGRSQPMETMATAKNTAAKSASTYSVFNEKLVDTLLRHLESVHGTNFYSSRDDLPTTAADQQQQQQQHSFGAAKNRIRSGKVDFTELTYLETIVLILLFYIRSYYLPSRFSVIRTHVEQASDEPMTTAAAPASQAVEHDADAGDPKSKFARGVSTTQSVETESYASADERSNYYEQQQQLRSSSLGNLSSSSTSNRKVNPPDACRKTRSHSDIYNANRVKGGSADGAHHETAAEEDEAAPRCEEMTTTTTTGRLCQQQQAASMSTPCPDQIDQRDNSIYIENRGIQIYCVQLLNSILQELLKLCQFSMSDRPSSSMPLVNGGGSRASSCPNYLQIVESLFSRCELPKALLYCFSSNSNSPQANSMANCILRPKVYYQQTTASKNSCKNLAPDRKKVDLSYTCELMGALESVVKLEKMLKDYQTTVKIQSRLATGNMAPTDSLGRDRSNTNSSSFDAFLLTMSADAAVGGSSNLSRQASFASSNTHAHYIQNQVVSQQSMFISTVLFYLKHLGLVEYHLPVLSLIKNTLASSGSALKSLATFVIEQLCRNLLQIASDVNLLLVSSNLFSHKLPPTQKSYEALLAKALSGFVSLHENPNLVLSFLNQLAAILSYCLVNSKSVYLSDITNGLISLAAIDGDSSTSSGSSGGSSNEAASSATSPISSSLLVDNQIKVLKSHLAEKENDLAMARESLLNLLPNILTCMCHLWHRSNILINYASKTSSNNWNALNVQVTLLKNSLMLGDPVMINKSITELLNPIAAFHSQSLVMAITIVWGEKRKRFKSSHVHIVNEQPVLIELIGSLKSFQLPTLLANVVEFLKANCTKEKKKTANCVWILQFLHSYLEYFWSAQFAKLTFFSSSPAVGGGSVTVNEVAASMMSFYKECLMTSLTSNLTPICYFQLMKILHDSLNMTAVLIDEKKFSKDLQDFTHKLFELCNSIVASSLQQTTWLRKNFAVKLTPVSTSSGNNNTSSSSTSSGYQTGLGAGASINASSQSNLTTASSPSNSIAPTTNGGVINDSASVITSATTGSSSIDNISFGDNPSSANSTRLDPMSGVSNLATSVSTMNFSSGGGGVSASPSLSDYGMTDSMQSVAEAKSKTATVNSATAASFLKMDEISEALVQQNMVDVNSYYYAEPNNELKENYSLQALNILADYLPKIFDIVYKSEEKERLTVPLLFNLMSNLWPFLKTHSIANKNNYRAASLLLMHFTNYPYTRKTWKKEVFELLFDNSFFHVDFLTLDYWRVIVDNLISNDRSMFKDVLIRVTYQQSSGLFTSKEQESDQKALLLKRLAYVIFASERDQYQKHMPEIQECIAHVLKLSQSSNVYSSLFLLFRILLLRVSSRHLIALWTTILTEVIVILLQMELDLNDDNDLINNNNNNNSNHNMAAPLRSHPPSLKSNPSSYASLSSNILLPSNSSQSSSQQTLSNSQYQLDYVVYASSSIASFNVNSKLQTYLAVCKLIDLIMALPSSITSQFQFHKWCFYSDQLPLGKQPPEQFIPYLIKLNNLFQAKYPGLTAQDLDLRNRLADTGSHPESELRLYTAASYRDKKTLASLRDLKGFFDCISKNAYVKHSLTTNQQYFVLQHNQAKQQTSFITPIQPASQQNINSIFLKLFEPSVQEDFVESWIE